MIVKNEAHCISKCLESVKNHIDYWIICDTGSDDDTEKVVKDILKDIPGEFHKHEWIDFSTNRNLSLGLAKNKADYTLIMDADDYLTVEDKISPQNSAYKIEIIYNTISYYRIQLIRNDIEARYVGVLHEYLDVPNCNVDIMKDCKIYCGSGLSARSKDTNKFLKDVQVLEKALLEEPNNSRYFFYCAQSYRDAGLNYKALEYYLKRAEMGGWIEEVYYSLLEAAKLLEKLFPLNIESVESTYLKAHNVYPQRIESLVYLSGFCRKNNLFDKAYFYSKNASTISKPSEGLFLEFGCYDWKVWDELAIAAYYVGKLDEAVTLNKYLLSSDNLPKSESERIKNNLKICHNLSG